MRLLAERSMTTVALTFDVSLRQSPVVCATQLRGALGKAFADDDNFHQHDEGGRPVYRYPMIQYRWANANGIVVGWEAASEKLRNIAWLDLQLMLGNKDVRITDATIELSKPVFGKADRLKRYRFRSPVLLFNQDNFHRYQHMSGSERRDELDRLLIAHILVALRGMGVEFAGRLYAGFTEGRALSSPYKGNNLLGIKGEFVSNACLPEAFAVGHAVSHGFGWITQSNVVP